MALLNTYEIDRKTQNMLFQLLIIRVVTKQFSCPNTATFLDMGYDYDQFFFQVSAHEKYYIRTNINHR